MIHDGEGHTILYQVQQALDSYIQKVAGKINASHSASIEEKANFERLWRATFHLWVSKRLVHGISDVLRSDGSFEISSTNTRLFSA